MFPRIFHLQTKRNEKHLQQQISFPYKKKIVQYSNESNNQRAVKDIQGPAKLLPEKRRTLGSIAIAVLAVNCHVINSCFSRIKANLAQMDLMQTYAKVYSNIVCKSQIFSA
jgi:hypothetical protein